MMITVTHMNVDEPNPPKKKPTFIAVSELVSVVSSVNGVSVLWGNNYETFGHACISVP